MDEIEITALIREHFKLWSERSSTIRMEGIKKKYTEDVLVISHYEFNGFQKMNDYIETLLNERPNYSFDVFSPVESHHNVARVSWRFGPPNDPSRVTGQDFFTFENGKIRSLYVFLDKKNVRDVM